MANGDGGLAVQARPFQLRIGVDGVPFACLPDRDLLAAMEAAGAKGVGVGCRGGGCGRCRVRVVSGEYVTGKMTRNHVSVEEEKRGYGLACRIYPRSDLVVTWEPLQPGTPR